MVPIPRRLVLISTLAAPTIARAQQQRPVTIVVPFAAGGSTDVLSRLMAERMTQTLGQTVLVENRPGGNTIVGAEYVARAQPDGNSPADIPALIAAAKADPGGITYGTNGPTTLTNVAMLLVTERLGIRMQDVTYRGDSAALNDFVAGNLDTLVVAGSTAVPVFRNGQGRLIGWTSLQRMPTTPEVPTVAEFAPGTEALSWFGLLAPARTAPAQVQRLHDAAAESLKDPRIQERLTRDAQFIVGNTPEEFAQL